MATMSAGLGLVVCLFLLRIVHTNSQLPVSKGEQERSFVTHALELRYYLLPFPWTSALSFLALQPGPWTSFIVSHIIVCSPNVL